MTTLNRSHFIDTASHFLALLDQFGDGGLDPDFDDAHDELERQFAELRMSLPYHN